MRIIGERRCGAPETDMVSANISAVINNEMRFFIFSPPFAHSSINTLAQRERRMKGRQANGEAPPLSLCAGVGLSLGPLCI